MAAKPLEGIRVIEFAGLAPGPLCGLVLADLGATVIRVDNPVSVGRPPTDLLTRGKQSIAISPKTSAGLATLRRLISASHVLIDPFRPGVMESLGLGPDVFLGPQGQNPRLVYARLVGYDRRGELKNMAGHDLNYLAHAGVLGMMPPTTPEGRPSFPLNILADMAGGGLLCATGILAALFSLTKSPTARGKIVETDMVAGSRYISSFNLMYALIPGNSMFAQPTGESLLDGGAPFYNSYQCADGGWMSVACLEPQFYSEFCALIERNVPDGFIPPPGATQPEPATQQKREQWRSTELWIAAAFKTRPRHEWHDIFKGTDACTVPVLTPAEAAEIHGPDPVPHPNLVDLSSSPPAPAPRSQHTSPSTALRPGAHTFEILRKLGMDSAGIEELRVQGALGDQSQRPQSKL